MAKERIFGYDALKAISAFLVVLYHVFLIDFGYKEGEFYYPTISLVLWLFIACSVPLFFMVNGALTVHRTYSFKTYMVKTARLLFIGIFWGLVLRMFFVARYQDFSYFSSVSITRYWFFFTLALLYFLQFFLNKAPGWCKTLIIIALLVFPFLNNFVWDVIIFVNPSVSMPSWGHSGFYTIYSLVYLYAGDYFAHRRYGKWCTILCLVMGLALLVFEAVAVTNHTHKQFDVGSYCLPTIGALLLSIAMFLLVKEWRPKSTTIRKLFTFFGNNSMGIYIIHILLLVVVRGMFPELKTMTFHPIIVLLIALSYTVVSALISELIRKSPLAFLMKI